MPFYIRKSLSFGPIRFNLSKSGIGASAGIKGFRLGSGPKGNYVHMGRGGLYYRATLPSSSHNKKDRNNTQNNNSYHESHSPQNQLPNDIIMEEIDSNDVGNIVDSTSAELVKEINEKQEKVRFLPIFMALGCLIAIFAPVTDTVKLTIFITTLALSIPLYIYDKNRKTTVIFYDIDKEAEELFKAIYNSFERLKQSKKIWHISAKGNINDSKYHAGANQAVNRKEIKINFKNPAFIKTNIPTPSIPVGTQTIYFFPDKILIFEKNKVGGLSYENANFAIGTSLFVEEESVPTDSEVVDHTWRYVNKRGGPDKRFKDNKKLPIAKYETTHLTSNSGLNELIYISKVGQFAHINKAIDNIKTLS